MAIKNYNIPPYYDDFDQSKNYVRVLFRPGYAVQARELTQLQTAIQAQIDRFGSHVFKEGSPVLGGQATLDTKYAYVKLESSFTDGGNTYTPEGGGSPYYTSALEKTLTGVTSGITATVLEILPTVSTAEPLTAFVRYTAAATDNLAHQFAPEEILTFVDSASVTKKFKVKNLASSPVGYGTRVSVNEGVYFVKGNFVYTSAESLLVSRYTQNPSARIVYRISENIVTSAEDSSLVDNSLGTPNESAPGAHRYQIALDLVAEPYLLAGRTEENVIQVLLISGGNVTGRARTEYSELARTLATRTYEESGNYTVRPFQINVREYYKDTDTNNGGLYSLAEIQAANPTFTELQAKNYGKARLAVGLEPSVAYVSGYRVETLSTTYVPLEKARDEAYINGASIFCPLGGYIYVKTVVGLPDITTFGTINLKISGTKRGTARVRNIEYVDGTYYKLFLFDIAMDSGYVLNNVTTIDNTAATFSADCDDIDSAITYTVLYEPSTSSLLYPLPVNAVQSLRSSDNITIDFSYYVRRKYTKNSDTSGYIVLNSDDSNSEVYYSVTQGDYIIIKTSDGSVLTQSATPVISNNGGTVTLKVAGISIITGCTIIAPSQRKNLQEKSKTLVTSGSLPVATPTSTISLGHSDVTSFTVYMSSALATAASVSDTNVTDRYILDDGQRDNFYDVASIQLKPGMTAATGQLLIKFSYFTHGAGDYFSVNSYSGIDYDKIPTFNSVKGALALRDVVDFRPVKSDDGTGFSGTGASTTFCVVPNSMVQTDIQFYLPRMSKIYVNKNGEFGAVNGVSGVTPKPPEDPEDSMVLYTVSLGAYTFGPDDINAKIVENKRYTMRDIGRLEKRIANVEYYTSLSLLEKSAANTQIFDSTGNQRYKNGFIVDSFVDHNVGAINHPDYRCSIEAEKGILLPQFSQKYVNLVPNLTGSTNIKQTGSLITLDYREVNLIEQPYSSYSEYVNPHAVYGWQGRLELSPPSDDWKEVKTKPAIVANASQSYNWFYDANATIASDGSFNNWQVNWFGVSPEEEENLNQQLVNSGTLAGYSSVTAMQVSGELNNTTYFGTATYRPTMGAYNSTQSSQIADTVVDNTVVPYIRSRKIYFKATGLKPNSRVYAFFDGVNVDNYVQPEASFNNYTVNPNDTDYSGYTQHPDVPAPLVTGNDGSVIGSFVIPHNAALKFRTGERIFRLVDNQLNNTDTAFTYAETLYRATGIFVPAATPSVQPPIIIPTPVPAPAITIAPSVGLSVEGRSPKYAGIPFNFNAFTSATGYGPLSSFVVEERSSSTSPSLGSWVSLAYISGTVSGVYNSSVTYRISPALPGNYEVRAKAVWNGNTYYSNSVFFTVAPIPDELIGQPTDSSFYN